MKSPKPLIGYENVTYASVTYATVGWDINPYLMGFGAVKSRNSGFLAGFPQIPAACPQGGEPLEL
jgi:hypothetical protein